MIASVVEARGARSMPYIFLPEIVGVLLLRKGGRYNKSSLGGSYT